MNKECTKLVERARDRVISVKAAFAKILSPQFHEKAKELVSVMTWGMHTGNAQNDLLRYRAGIKVLSSFIVGKSDDEQLARDLLNQAISALDDALACSAAA